MRFIINSEVLSKNLSAVSGVITNNNTLPILNNILFVLENNKLTLTGSDLETTIKVTIDVPDAAEDGKIAIPAKLILDTMKKSGTMPAAFTINEETLAVEITAGEGKYKLTGENANGYPDAPMTETAYNAQISSAILLSAISNTIFATGNDELRPVMSGVFFDFGETSSTFVATDAHKLVKYGRKDAAFETPASFILPKKPLNILKNILGSLKEEINVQMNFSDKNVFFSLDNVQIISRLIDGKYPNYEAVIPKNNDKKLIIDRGSFLLALERVSLYSSQSTPQARLKVNGKELILSAEDIDIANEAKERLTCNYEGEPIEIGFNSKFLHEMVNNIKTDEICIEMSVPTRAGIILPVGNDNVNEEILMLVMPIMLN